MTGRTLPTLILALAASLVVSQTLSQAQTSKQPATKAETSVPAEYQGGIAELRVAKGYLEKAGDKWCGHRANGISFIDQTFKALGVSTESTPHEMQTGNIDEPGMMNGGMSSLRTAKADIEKVGNDWGGRKERAVKLIDQALKELQEGVDCAKKNKTY
jgi:hypothetical protein